MISGGASITIRDTATPVLDRLAVAMRRETYKPAVGQAGVRVLMDHLKDKNADQSSHSTANQLQARPSGLYADFARALSYSRSATGVVVSINHVAARQRYHGGTIKPVNAKMLTIPASAKSYGRSAGEFSNLFVMSGKQGPFALAERESTDISISKDRRKGRSGMRVKAGFQRGGGIMFWLVRSVTQQPDDTVLPAEDALISGIMSALEGWLKKIRKEGAPNV